jgi:hypothetical protein
VVPVGHERIVAENGSRPGGKNGVDGDHGRPR